MDFFGKREREREREMEEMACIFLRITLYSVDPSMGSTCLHLKSASMCLNERPTISATFLYIDKKMFSILYITSFLV